MSTYATTVWIDVPPAGPVARVAEGLDALREPSWGDADEPVVWIDAETEWIRLSAYLVFRVELVDQVADLLASAGRGRAAIAEDCDEYGARWVVLAVEDGIVRTLHRRYVLNADPHKPREVRRALRSLAVDGEVRDPRDDDVAGVGAATEAALLFEVDPRPMIDAEATSDRAFERIGLVGGPFPWLGAVGLVWPGPEAGRRFRRVVGA